MYLHTLKRKIIVWYYKDKEPYKSRRLERKVNKFLRNFSYGLITVANNIEPMVKAFNDMKIAVGNIGRAFLRDNRG